MRLLDGLSLKHPNVNTVRCYVYQLYSFELTCTFGLPDIIQVEFFNRATVLKETYVHHRTLYRGLASHDRRVQVSLNR